jgi:hypothetical protein
VFDMVSLVKRVLVVWLCGSLAACSTMREVSQWRPAGASSAPAPAGGLGPGDDLRVTLVSSEAIGLRLTTVEPDALVGVPNGTSTPRRVPLDQIAAVERKETDPLKTTGLVIGVTLLAALLYAAAWARAAGQILGQVP